MQPQAKLMLRDDDEFTAAIAIVSALTDCFTFDKTERWIALSVATYRTPMDTTPLQGETLGGRMMRLLSAYREDRYKRDHIQDELELERTLQDGKQQES